MAGESASDSVLNASAPADGVSNGTVPDLSLSASQRDAIATYLAVTESESHEAAIAALTVASWNVQNAVEMFLSGSTPSAPPRDPPPSSTVVATRPRTTRPRWLLALLSPLRVLWTFVRRLLASAARVLGGPAAALEASPGATAAARFLSFYESLHGRVHPAFFDGSYLSALAAAQTQTKFLLVYLHAEGHAETASFCTRVLADPTFIGVAHEEFVMWAGAVTQPDGAAAQHALRAPGFPFLAVVHAPRATVRADGLTPPLSSAHFGRVLSMRAAPTVNSLDGAGLARWLADVMRRHAGLLESVRAERATRERDRQIIQEQNREYARSLEADRRREQAAREEEEGKLRIERAVKEREERRRRKKEELGEEVENGPGVCKVMLRLPDGTRVNRRFEKDEKLERVFDWAEVNCVDIEVACLVTNYPRKSFRYPEDAGQSLLEAGLFPSAMLLLEERVDVE